MGKKVFSFLAALLLVFTSISTGFAHKEFDDSQSNLVEKDMISVIEPYVQVGEDGKISLKDVSPELYEKYDLQLLEEHFNVLNTGVENNEIFISEDLTVTNNVMSPNAVYGSWTYHWWGYDRKFNNSQTEDFIDYATSVAGGAGIITGVGAFFPPVAAIAGVQTGYWTLVAARASANNKGKGIYIGVTWVAVFNIEPL